MSQESRKSTAKQDEDIGGSEQDLTSPDKTGSDIDASDAAAHASMPSTSDDEARAQAARKQEDADDPPPKT